MTTLPQLSFDFDSPSKRCARCNEWKPLDSYHNVKANQDGRHYSCKLCINSAYNRRRSLNAESQRQRDRENYAKRRTEDPEGLDAIRKRWYESKGRSYHRKWQEDNREQIRAQKRERYRKDPQKNIAATLAREAKRKGSKDGCHTNAEWKALCAKFDNRCACCYGKVKLTRDHITPLNDSGSDAIWSIQPLCRSCNSRKNARHINYRPDRLLTGHVTVSKE